MAAVKHGCSWVTVVEDRCIKLLHRGGDACGGRCGHSPTQTFQPSLSAAVFTCAVPLISSCISDAGGACGGQNLFNAHRSAFSTRQTDHHAPSTHLALVVWHQHAHHHSADARAPRGRTLPPRRVAATTTNTSNSSHDTQLATGDDHDVGQCGVGAWIWQQVRGSARV